MDGQTYTWTDGGTSSFLDSGINNWSLTHSLTFSLTESIYFKYSPQSIQVVIRLGDDRARIRSHNKSDTSVTTRDLLIE